MKLFFFDLKNFLKVIKYATRCLYYQIYIKAYLIDDRLE